MPASSSVDVKTRTFCIVHGSDQRNYGIPDGYDMRVSDLEEIVNVANSIVGADREDWWEVSHTYKKEPKRFKCYNFSLHYVGKRDSPSCFVQWECNSEGYQRSHGIRGFELGEDRLGGIITDQQMDELFYNVANTEERAMEDGYVLEIPWLLRVLDDETGALVQMRVSASWNKPPRWKAVPL